MKILLLAMPDVAEVLDYTGRLPTIALPSLAGQLVGHEVHTLDLVTARPKIRRAVDDAMTRYRPDLVGLSAMTFQFDTLLRVARHIRHTYPGVRLMAGGYHVTLTADELTATPDLPLDYLIRGEGELTIRELVDALAAGIPPAGIAGLTWRDGARWQRNPDRELADLARLRLPDRSHRLNNRFAYLGMPIDTIETSRGCPFNCRFCSITKMYGHAFRTFPIPRIIEDLKNVKAAGARSVFLVDDNIAYAPDHFTAVCNAIIEHQLNDLYYVVQMSAIGIARNPDLIALMDKANFRSVFVGFESMLDDHLKDMSKPTNPDINRQAAALLKQHHMGIIAGIIAGYPDDTRATVHENFRRMRALEPDSLYAQYLTPYPKTEIRREMLEQGLITNPDDLSLYDGFTCNVRTRHLTQDQLFRLLKWEAMTFFVRPGRKTKIFFLERFGWNIIFAGLRTLRSDLYNIITGKRLATRLDI